MDADWVQRILEAAPNSVKVSLASNLIGHLKLYGDKDRLDRLRILLDTSTPVEGEDLLDSFIVMGKVNEATYAAGIKEVAKPYHRSILMIALVELDTKKYEALGQELAKLIVKDKKAQWYFEKRKRVNEWYEKEFLPMYEK